MKKQVNLADFLEDKYKEYSTTLFIKDDPIGIPHRFSQLQDIEIAGFFAAILAWGQRKTIINKCNLLMEYMGNTPYDFIKNHTDTDLKPFENFKHRTFNSTDVLYFIDFLKRHYSDYSSLEDAFLLSWKKDDDDIGNSLIGFSDYFKSHPDFPQRTSKHIATPARKSACKRLSMYLRWMVRKDANGVDFGVWNTIKPSQLICPLDVHVERVSKKLGLLTRKPTDWKAAQELTQKLKQYAPDDPVKYDFALFGLGLEGFADDQ